MNKKQITVIVIAVVITGYLYSLHPVRAKMESQSVHQNGGVAKAQRPAVNINVDVASATAKTVVGANLPPKITELEGQLKSATGDADKLKLQKALATEWNNVNQPAPAAFYYQAVAKQENTVADWIEAGNHFNDAYRLTQDTTAQPVYDANAVEAFQNALKLQPENLDAKTGLGIAYVNGGGTPMQGIGLLLEVVGKDPKNLKASLNLGLFSMKSGQFDKAVERFKAVIAQKPDVEPYFYLAESYKQLGMRKEAIGAYQKCKELMPDPTFDQKIDDYIKELKN